MPVIRRHAQPCTHYSPRALCLASFLTVAEGLYQVLLPQKSGLFSPLLADRASPVLELAYTISSLVWIVMSFTSPRVPLP